MTAPDPGLDPVERRVRRRQSRLIPIAHAVLVWEKLWPRLWPVVGVAGVFVSVALFDVLPLLPFWLHGYVLLGFSALLVWVSYAGFRSFPRTGPDEIRTRIERDSQLGHHPLTTLDDEDASGLEDSTTMALWREHRRRAVQASQWLRVRLPSPGLARVDPYGLRAAVLLLLVIAVTAGFDNAGVRMARALVPVDDNLAAGVRVDIWVSPPSYTGYPPFHVFEKKQATARDATETAPEEFVEIRTIPVGSTILSQVGGEVSPSFVMANRKIEFDPIGDAGFRLETTAGVGDVVDGISTIAVWSGKKQIVGWRVRVIDDTAPVIEFTQPPSNTGQGRLRVAFSAADDFGLDTATLVIRNPMVPADSPDGDTVRLSLPLSRTGAVTVETAVIRDLSEHDWAGLSTELRLETSDALGQVGRSDSITMVLPERIFNHPVARALNDYRKQLIAPSSSDVVDVVTGLDGLSEWPEHFSHDAVVFLALRVARARLVHDGTPTVMKPLRRLLWNTALRIEDGEFALAGRELSKAQEALEQALRDGAYSDTIEDLLTSLDKALDKFLSALEEELAEKGMTDLSDIPGLSFLEQADLKQMIEDARELARTGSMDAAQSTLNELRTLLQSIESAMESGQSMDQFGEMREMMESLSGVSRDQQELLDQTFQQMRRARGSGGGPTTPGSGQQGAEQQGPGQQDTGQQDTGQQSNGEGTPSTGPAEMTRGIAPPQEDLRRQLGDLMLGLDQLFGAVPESIGDAAMAMGRAVGSLRTADPGAAVGHQTEAMDALRRATEEVVNQIAQQLRAMPGNMPSPAGSVPSSGNDPFGRQGGGATGAQLDDGSVKVPSQMERKRAREIYEELRRRAGNPDRSITEREYIHRLLRQF